MTCQKTQEFLAKNKVTPAETVDAKKNTIDKSHALKMASGAEKIIATKGKKVVELDLAKSRPGADELSSLVIGPSGNLRAPAARIGKTLLVGFDPDMYAAALK